MTVRTTMILGMLLAAAKADHRFVSISKLRELVTMAAVETHLDAKGIKLSTQLDPRMVARSRILIAILILLGLESHIDDALSKGANDKMFPAREEAVVFLEDREDRYRFCREQWVVPPVLSSEDHMELPREAILPFIYEVPIGHGSFGKVYRTKVADGHLTHHEGNEVAWKMIEMENMDHDRVLMGEVISLRKRPHANIVPLLASFTKSSVESSVEIKSINLIFPYAEMDLEAWMSLPETPVEYAKNRRIDLYRSTYELVSALAFLHREHIDGFSTSHHDLKPKNILVFGRKWKIADFGRAKLRASVQESETAGADGLGSYDYHPPEYYNDDGTRAPRNHGRPFDVWAMGCIMLQVAVLVAYGWESGMMVEFRRARRNLASNQRRFSKKREGEDSSFHNSLAEVDGWIGKIMGDGSKMLRQFLEIIIQMLRGDPRDRLASWEVELDLYELLYPDDSLSRRLKISEAGIPPPPNPPSDKPLIRAALSGNAVRTVCLLGAGWHLVLPTEGASVTLVVSDVPLWKELLEAHSRPGPIDLSGFREKVLQQPLVHSTERHGFQLTPDMRQLPSPMASQEMRSTNSRDENDPDLTIKLDLIRRHIRHDDSIEVQNLLKQLPNNLSRYEDKFGQNPLHYAVEYYANEWMTEVILKSCPSPDGLILQPDRLGRTPFHIAAGCGHFDMILAFLRYVKSPADAIGLKDASGDTSVSLARKSGHNELALYLQEFV